MRQPKSPNGDRTTTEQRRGGAYATGSDLIVVEGLDVGPAAIEAARKRTLNPSAMREMIPVHGFREYWYPATIDRKVGRRRPTKIHLLNEDVVLYRAKNGDVVASTNVCPHRGGSMGDGHCHYAGTISCPYHGWTFDEKGECVAVLGEGPESPIPGNAGARLKIYPTITLKGLVFIWMGEREPVDPREDIPPEFFMEEARVEVSATNWRCNWRQAMENLRDAHVFYVHKNSMQELRRPTVDILSRKGQPTLPRPAVIDGVALGYPNGGSGKQTARGSTAYNPNAESARYRDSYPGLNGQLYPKHEFRVYWAKLMDKTVPFRWKASTDPKWRGDDEVWAGFHLPGMFRTFGQGNYVYTRSIVPIDAKRTRAFYYYTYYGRTPFERLFNKAWYTFASSWFKNHNFSGQDQAVMEPQTYDRPEELSATDFYSIATRRLMVERGRDFMPEKSE